MKISTLKKQVLKTWWIKAIELVRDLHTEIFLRTKNSNTFPKISKKHFI